MKKVDMKKPDLINLLVEQFGYEKEDLKFDADGKPWTNAKLKALIEQEENDAKEMDDEATRFVAKETKLKDDDMIVVMNGLGGALTHRSETTGRTWRFKEFGQTSKMPFAELLSLKNTSPAVFEECWIVVMDKEVQKQFELTDKYKNILTPENINHIFNKDIEDLKEFVENLPQGMKSTFVTKARELYHSKKLYDMRVIRYIEEKFGFSLEDNAPLSDFA